MMTHDERCAAEATRDVIFILQSRRRHVVKLPDGVEFDGEGFVLTKVHKNYRPDDACEGLNNVTRDDIAEMGEEYVIDYWLPKSVWLDRSEAEAWGEAHAYRFENPNKGVGWRVYGVPAEGDLAKAIREHDGITSRVEKLEAVVAKLPKDADGNPVTPQDTLWQVQSYAPERGALRVTSSPGYFNGDIMESFRQYYISKEAAEAAREN